MPQMYPLMWMMLYIYFIIILILFFIMNYYNFKKIKTNMNTNYFKKMNNFKFNWKW
uniref:ATP synthase F0 subunit 8 n=1 Tax=Profenusa thomsoni TaxID=430669 RepID=UPI002E7A838B|nr:ATP synthase F0 subunit 8 [Profenusa thomsoni]WPN89807.1 ATP synthase F0 subunit 8 [Profenusa thomsoni]